MNAKISVVVPVYNAETFLEKTIPCILSQTLRDIQVILVDDGSSDGSYAICQRFAEEDERVLALTKENGGASTARNLGILHAAADLVGFVDCDDYIYPDMYENLLKGWQKAQEEGHGKVLIQIGREEIDEEGNRLPDAITPPEETAFLTGEEMAASLLLYTGDSSFCTKLVPKELLEKHPLDPGTLGEDFGLHMKMLDDIEGVVLLPETGYRVVHRAGSATRRRTPDQFSKAYIDIIRQSDMVEEKIVPSHPGLADKAVRFGLYERLDYLLHVPIRDMRTDNAFYEEVLQYLRIHFADMLKSPYLTARNKLYLTILTAAPRFVRRVHRLLRARQIMNDR